AVDRAPPPSSEEGGLVSAPQLPFPRPDVLSVGPLYAPLRATAPLYAVRTPAGDPAWLVTSHALTRKLLADPRLGRSHPEPERDRFRTLSEGAGGLTDRAASQRALHDLIAYIRELLPGKRRAPGEDVLSDLVAADPENRNADATAGLAAMLLFAGHETTVTR